MREKLNQFHITILIYMTQSVFMLFNLPRTLAENFGTNGWLALFVCSAVATSNIFLISLVYRYGQGRSVFAILEQSIPKAILFPFYLALATNCALFGCMALKQYILLIQMVSFPATNPMVFKLLCDILVLLLVRKGIYNISKAATVFYYCTFWMIFTLFFFFTEYRWERLTPFVFQGGTNQIDDWLELYLAFLGYEVCIFFFPYVARKTKFFAAVYWGNFLLTFVYGFVSIICFGFFSFQQVSNLTYPLVDLLAYIELPFVERIENLLFALFIFKILVTTTVYSWVAIEILERVFTRSKRSIISFFVIAACFLFAYYPEVMSEVENWVRWLGYIQMCVAFGLPLLLLLCLLLHKVYRKEESPNA